MLKIRKHLDSREKFEPRTSRCLNWLYNLSYPGSIDGTGVNLSLESNTMQRVLVYGSICRQLTSELTSLFLYSDILNQIDKCKLTYDLCLTKLQCLISREKLPTANGRRLLPFVRIASHS